MLQVTNWQLYKVNSLFQHILVGGNVWRDLIKTKKKKTILGSSLFLDPCISSTFWPCRLFGWVFFFFRLIETKCFYLLWPIFIIYLWEKNNNFNLEWILTHTLYFQWLFQSCRLSFSFFSLGLFTTTYRIAHTHTHTKNCDYRAAVYRFCTNVFVFLASMLPVFQNNRKYFSHSTHKTTLNKWILT